MKNTKLILLRLAILIALYVVATASSSLNGVTSNGTISTLIIQNNVENNADVVYMEASSLPKGHALKLYQKVSGNWTPVGSSSGYKMGTTGNLTIKSINLDEKADQIGVTLTTPEADETGVITKEIPKPIETHPLTSAKTADDKKPEPFSAFSKATIIIPAGTIHSGGVEYRDGTVITVYENTGTTDAPVRGNVLATGKYSTKKDTVVSINRKLIGAGESKNLIVTMREPAVKAASKTVIRAEDASKTESPGWAVTMPPVQSSEPLDPAAVKFYKEASTVVAYGVTSGETIKVYATEPTFDKATAKYTKDSKPLATAKVKNPPRVKGSTAVPEPIKAVGIVSAKLYNVTGDIYVTVTTNGYAESKPARIIATTLTTTAPPVETPKTTE